MIHHIIGNHLKRKNPQQKSDEQKIKSDLAITIPPTPDTNTDISATTDISAKENTDAQFFKQTSKGYECLKCPAKRSKRPAMRQHVKEKHLTISELTIKDSSNKENEIEKGKGNDLNIVNVSDIINVKKQCENCKQFFIGTKKEVQEKLYQHIKTRCYRA